MIERVMVVQKISMDNLNSVELWIGLFRCILRSLFNEMDSDCVISHVLVHAEKRMPDQADLAI